MARAHVRPPRHRLDRVLARDILDDLSLDLAKRLARRLLRCERGAELRLVAGPAQEQHQVASDRQRSVTIQVLLHERQRKVHPRGHARGRPHVAIAQEDRLSVDAHLGIAASELGRRRPVLRRPASVEQAGARQQEGAGAHRCRAPGGTGFACDPLDQYLVFSSLLTARAAGHDQRVDLTRRGAQASIWRQRQAARAAQRLAVAAHDRDLVAASAAQPGANQLLGAGEDLQRTGRVEALHARIDDDHDLSGSVGRRCHRPIMNYAARVCKDRFPTISATPRCVRTHHVYGRCPQQPGSTRSRGGRL